MRRDWLALAQITTLAFIGCLVLEYALWLAWKPKPVLAATLTALAGYLSLIWAVFRRSPEGWLQAGFIRVFRSILSTMKWALYTLVFSGTGALLIGILLFNAWRGERMKPNYIVQLYYSTLADPAVGARVTVNNPLRSTRLEDSTDSLGLARFRLESGLLVQISIAIEQDELRRETMLPVERIDSLPNARPVDLDLIQNNSWIESPSNEPQAVEFASAKSETLDHYFRSFSGRSQIVGEPQFLRTHLPWGVPGAKIVISRREYAAGFDPVRRIPRWTAYKAHVDGSRYPREPDRFLPDPLIPADQQASQEAYAKNPYDRAHLVYRHDIDGHGTDPRQVVSYMSVVAPQIGELNRKVWLLIEQYGTALSESDDIWIIAGPAFIPRPGDDRIEYAMIGGNVAVPTHFFRILVKRKVDSTIEAVAFLVPNVSDVRPPIDQYLTPIDTIESYTGLDFFASLNEQVQRRLESATPTLW